MYCIGSEFYLLSKSIFACIISFRFVTAPDPMCICMHYIDNNHFNLLIPKKTLTELLNTVVQFGIGLGGFCSDHRTDFINAQLTQDIARDVDGEVAETGDTADEEIDGEDAEAGDTADGDIDEEVAVAMDIDGEVGWTSNPLESAMKLLSNVEKAIIGDKSKSHIGNCDVVSQSNPGNNGAVTFSDSIRSQIALTPSISSLPFYSHRETISDIEYDIYQFISLLIRKYLSLRSAQES
jgi:hypothetical protein